MAEADETEQQRRARKNDMLKMYYQAQNGNNDDASLDIDSNQFQADEYIRKLKQEKNLEQLMDTEHDMVRKIRTLDSEMQTLVYENYNKFISATDTIRTMKRDFHKMEDEMEKLTRNVQSVSVLSSEINDAMHKNRQRIQKLSGVHSLLKKLQFLFELPTRLSRCLETKSYAAAVTYYSRTRSVLSRYQHMESFSGIQKDCIEIMDKIIVRLKEVFHNKESTTQQLAQCVELLLKLGEPAASLCDDYLDHTKAKLRADLRELESYITYDYAISRSSTKSTLTHEEDVHINNDAEIESATKDEDTQNFPSVQENPRFLIDVLEFVDRGSNGFLSNLSLTIAAYESLFINPTKLPTEPFMMDTNELSGEAQSQLSKIANEKLSAFVNEQLQQYFALVAKRLDFEKETSDNALLVRSLDRFYRRLQATKNLIPTIDVMSPSCGIVIAVAKSRCGHYSTALQQYFTDCLTDARHVIASAKGVASASQKSVNMLDLVNTTASSILNQVKSVLADVQLFTARDINFSSLQFFKREFSCEWIREGVIVNFIRHLCKTMDNFCNSQRGVGGKSPAVPPALLLLLSRVCKDFELSTVAYILTLTDEQFGISERHKITSASELTAEVGNIAQKLLESYVKHCGQSVSRMLRTSVETRDWTRSVEPRQVRAVMRRVVEEISQVDTQVGSLYEEGLRKAHSSDSSRRNYHPATSTSRRGRWGNYAQSSNMDNSLMSNIQKLFSERVDVFGPVEFSRMSVLTGVVKIALKTLLECVRLRTFGKFGLQQLQVDCYYLQMYLWKFVSDENIMTFMLDEVMSSGIHRCIDPVRMEQSVIEVICERG